MIINLKVFGFFVKDWIITKFNAALIIAIDVGRFGIQNSKFRQQSPNPNSFAGALG